MFVRLTSAGTACVPPPRDDNAFQGFIKKPTVILTNMKQLLALSCSCNCSKPHTPCVGKVVWGGKKVSVARAAGAYPEDLCAKWAGLVKRLRLWLGRPWFS